MHMSYFVLFLNVLWTVKTLLSVSLKGIFHKGKVLTHFWESVMCQTLCWMLSWQLSAEDVLVSCLYPSYAIVPRISSKVQDRVFLLSRWFLLAACSIQELPICVHHPKPSPQAISLGPSAPLSHCPWCLSNLCSLTILVYLLWFWDIQHNRIWGF